MLLGLLDCRGRLCDLTVLAGDMIALPEWTDKSVADRGSDAKEVSARIVFGVSFTGDSSSTGDETMGETPPGETPPGDRPVVAWPLGYSDMAETKECRIPP